MRRIVPGVIILLILIVWVTPFIGLGLTSLRDSKLANETGFWRALTNTEIGYRFKTKGKESVVKISDNNYQITGNVFAELNEKARKVAKINNEPEPIAVEGSIVFFGPGASKPRQAAIGETIELRGGEFTINAAGDYIWTFDKKYTKSGKTVGVIIDVEPALGLRNFRRAFADEKMSTAIVNSFVVTIPATIIPITIAAFAAYAFAWMSFPGRKIIFVIVISLMVVPLQLAFIPVLSMYVHIAQWASAVNSFISDCIGDACNVEAKNFAGLWAAHTAFGLPLAIFLLNKYIAGLPKELLECARIDGASHFQIFTIIVLPLAAPALASYAIMQFLWVWNDLLVALILGPSNDLVLPIVIQKQIGTFKSELERLNASAFISMIVPLIVFLALQRYFAKGLLAGSIKGK